jgi:CheY-like chemotaxis protein
MTKILLADDSVTIQKVVELTFSDGESQVMAFGDGASALENALLDRPDIILSDVIMPGMNGYELCHKVKSDPQLKTIPFLFLKGTFESFDEEKAKECGADGHIVKPFESQELIARVKELIKMAREGQIAAVEPPVSEQFPEAPPAPAPPAAPRPVEPPLLAEQPPPPVPEAAAPAETSPFDFGGDTAGSAGADIPEEDDDLWNEVSLRESASPLIEDQILEEESFWGTAGDVEEKAPESPPAPPAGDDFLEEVGRSEILDLGDEAALDESPLTFSEERPSLDAPGEKRSDSVEAVEPPTLEDIYPAHSEGLEPFEEALPPAATREAVETPRPVEHGETRPSATGEDLEKLLGSRIEEAVTACLGPVIAETARKIIEEVAWEVIPDLAEAMIKSEIEKIKQKER